MSAQRIRKALSHRASRSRHFAEASQTHEYELYLAVENIDHTKTKARHPQTNGICERFHRTMLDEFYRVAFRKKVYSSIEELQVDVDVWLREYNEERTHTGKYCYGKTPFETLRQSTHLATEKMHGAWPVTADTQADSTAAVR